MEMNRRAAILGALALPAVAAAAAAHSEPGRVCEWPAEAEWVLTPGETLVGREIRYGKLVAPGRIYSIAEYNSAFGAHLGPDDMAYRGCTSIGFLADAVHASHADTPQTYLA